MFNTREISTGRLLIELLNDPDRKSIFKIIEEVLFLSGRFRRFPRHYFSRYLFKKDKTNIKDYLPDKFLYDIKPIFNDKEVREVLENKLYFNFFYNQFGISLPKILMYNHGKVFVVDKKTTVVSNAQEFKLILEKIVKDNPAGNAIFVKKTCWSYGGDQIYKVFLNEVEKNPAMISRLYKQVVKSGFIFQETIKQHNKLDKLNPSCLNTIRLDTFIDRDDKIEIMSGYLRTSINNSYVDNISSGGCMIPVDLKTGKLDKDGYSVLKVYGVKLMTEHPLTKTVFKDFSVPFFDEAKELVIKSAGLIPSLRLVGWDVGIGIDGPVLIEGNSDYNIAGNDLSYGGYRANPVFRKALREINCL